MRRLEGPFLILGFDPSPGSLHPLLVGEFWPLEAAKFWDCCLTKMPFYFEDTSLDSTLWDPLFQLMLLTFLSALQCLWTNDQHSVSTAACLPVNICSPRDALHKKTLGYYRIAFKVFVYGVPWYLLYSTYSSACLVNMEATRR
jgi:hypothetical protein